MNVAGPTGDEDTLFSILSIPGEIILNKGFLERYKFLEI